MKDEQGALRLQAPRVPRCVPPGPADSGRAGAVVETQYTLAECNCPGWVSFLFSGTHLP